jgi:hypothetical protein
MRKSGPSATGSLWGPRQAASCSPCKPCLLADPEDQFGATVGKVAGFSLHAGVAARADERKKLERLCRHDVQGCTSVAGGRKP